MFQSRRWECLKPPSPQKPTQKPPPKTPSAPKNSHYQLVRLSWPHGRAYIVEIQPSKIVQPGEEICPRWQSFQRRNLPPHAVQYIKSRILQKVAGLIVLQDADWLEWRWVVCVSCGSPETRSNRQPQKVRSNLVSISYFWMMRWVKACRSSFCSVQKALRSSILSPLLLLLVVVEINFQDQLIHAVKFLFTWSNFFSRIILQTPPHHAFSRLSPLHPQPPRHPPLNPRHRAPLHLSNPTPTTRPQPSTRPELLRRTRRHHPHQPIRTGRLRQRYRFRLELLLQRRPPDHRYRAANRGRSPWKSRAARRRWMGIGLRRHTLQLHGAWLPAERLPCGHRRSGAV